jgi:hypothetical protein
MSASLQVNLTRPGEAEGYRVETVANCVLVTGDVPAHQFPALTKMVSRKAVLDIHLARLAGVSFAMGLKADTKALSEQITQRILTMRPNMTPLERWLAVGQRGSSSDAMAHHLAGAPLAGAPCPRSKTAHPHDADDFQRCAVLLAQVPELQPRLPRMAEVSPTWAALVAAWPAITAELVREGGPNWQAGEFLAPSTNVLIRAVLDGVSKEAP